MFKQKSPLPRKPVTGTPLDECECCGKKQAAGYDLNDPCTYRVFITIYTLFVILSYEGFDYLFKML